MMKVVSNDSVFTLRKISTKECLLNFGDVRGFVLYRHDKSVQLGLVTDSDILEESFTVQILSQTKTLYSFQFTDNLTTVNLQDILCLVSTQLQKKGTIVKVYANDWKSAQVKLSETFDN